MRINVCVSVHWGGDYDGFLYLMKINIGSIDPNRNMSKDILGGSKFHWFSLTPKEKGVQKNPSWFLQVDNTVSAEPFISMTIGGGVRYCAKKWE